MAGCGDRGELLPRARRVEQTPNIRPPSRHKQFLSRYQLIFRRFPSWIAPQHRRHADKQESTCRLTPGRASPWPSGPASPPSESQRMRASAPTQSTASTDDTTTKSAPSRGREMDVRRSWTNGTRGPFGGHWLQTPVRRCGTCPRRSGTGCARGPSSDG